MTDSLPSISVVTRTHRRPDALARAARYLRAQTVPFEWIVVNAGDAPLDSAILKGVGTACHVIDAGPLGRARAAKVGLERASGALLMIHDDDDTLEPDALGRLAEYLRDTPGDVAVTCGYTRVREGEGADVVEHTHSPAIPPTLYDMAERNRVLTVGTLFRADAYQAAGGMRTEVDALEDWDLWLRLLVEGDFGVIPDVLATQYVRGDTDGPAANSQPAEHEAARVRLLNRYLRDDIRAGRLGLGQLTHRPHARFVEEVDDRLRRAGQLKRALTPWRKPKE